MGALSLIRRVVESFIGGSNRLRASNQDVEDTINFYVEATAPGQSKTPGGLLPTPGLRFKCQVAGATNGDCQFAQDGRWFVVSHGVFAEIAATFVVTVMGSVTPATTSLPASIVSNGTAGNQLLIVSGGNGYVFDLLTNVLTLINGTNYPATGFPVGDAKQCEFLDGYGVVLLFDSRQFQISALEDFTSWDALDIAQRSEGSDNLMGVIRNHRELWFPGTHTGEVWYDSGDALFPFAPVPGVFLEYGAQSPSMVRVANTIAWMGLDDRGHGIINVADGYTPKKISTTAVDRDLQSSSQLGSAKLFAQQQEGHTFLWVRVPDLAWSWAYDFTTDTWAKRAIWNAITCRYERHPANSFAFAFDHQMVTSALNGSLYELDLTAYDDEISA